MPLPDKSISWPPKELANVTPALGVWNAWYTGDGDQLSRAYGALSGSAPQNRPSQYRGGLVGTVARWFWGQPTSVGAKRVKLHVPLAADISTASADMLFAEQLRLVTDKADQARRERLNLILQDNSWESLLPEAAEVAAALGGVFLRVTWDDAVSDYPIITSVHADAAWPEFRFGRLWAVTFWQVLEVNDQQTIRHLERHERGRVEHGLYLGTADSLGIRTDLKSHPTTANLTVDADASVETGFERLTAVYIPNIRPNKLWRGDPTGGYLGRSDFSGVEPLMDSLDETYTSWMRDVRLAKARLLVPQNHLHGEGRGQGATFDIDQEVFVELAALPGSARDQTLQVSAQQFAIRAADHEATATAFASKIVQGAGYSEQSFGLGDTGGAATATEIAARQRKSMTTREKKTRYWSPAIVEIIAAAMAVDAAKFNGPGQFTKPVQVEFPPSVQPTPLELAQTAQTLSIARAASTETLVRMVHPDWDKPEIDKETAAILAEKSVVVDLPMPPGFDEEPIDVEPEGE